MRNLSTLISSYRRTRLKGRNIESKIKKLNNQISVLRTEYNRIMQESNEIKNLVDFCIETGQSPVEARLTNSSDQIREHLSQSSLSVYHTTNYTYNVASAMTTATTLTSAGLSALPYSSLGSMQGIVTSANIGASGAIGSYSTTGAVGAVGSAGVSYTANTYSGANGP